VRRSSATASRCSIETIAGYRFVTSRNLELRATSNSRAITVTPETLGWRREDPRPTARGRNRSQGGYAAIGGRAGSR
jgi:hypothetical protein